MEKLLRITSLTVLLVSAFSRDFIQPNGNLYAVLVAGSNGWYNYRHQADVAHSYHTLLEHGVKKENIIVMMYDDIANDPRNPYKGQLFNSPYGPDVYQGLNIDYRGDSVNIPNFLAVLKGDAQAVKGGNGRVIHRQALTINDRIFVYFTDHGGSGIIAFPEGVMTAKLLNDALLTMHQQHQFGQLVFYMEACESGSMFKNILKNDINVYAVTAANEEESSYAAFCYTHLNLPCLGDEFSVNWMKYSDEYDLNYETLDRQFEQVKIWTGASHVMRYGNLSIGEEPVSWFHGAANVKPKIDGSNKNSQHQKTLWPSRDVELMHLLEMKKLYPHSAAVDVEISRIQKNRKSIEATFTNLVNALVSDENERRRVLEEKGVVENLDCHHDVVQVFDLICIDVNKHDYALQYMNVLNNLCTKFNDSAKIISAMWKTCSETRSQFF